jgi:predicted MarR family transcription regulator
MDNDLREFIRQEQVKLSNIQSGLGAQQRNKLLPKINQIRFLLQLLANEGSIISKKDRKDLEKKIDTATEKAQQTARKEQIREAINVSLINRIRPNKSEVPEMIRKKAVMVILILLMNI